MTTWRPRLGTLMLLILAAGACSTSTAPPSASHSAASPATTAPSVTPVPVPTIEQEPTLEPPPAATLVVGGRRLPGEVGSYVWAGGSDSAPWLPAGALEPAVVPAGGRADVEVAGSQAIESWTATSALADDPTAAQKVSLGSGTGPPALDLPRAGQWVVAVHLVFAGGLGDATWFWLLEAE